MAGKTGSGGPTDRDLRWDKKPGQGRMLRHTFSISCDSRIEEQLAGGNKMTKMIPMMSFDRLVDVGGVNQVQFKSDKDFVVDGKTVTKKGEPWRLTKEELRENLLNATGEAVQIEAAFKLEGDLKGRGQMFDQSYLEQVEAQRNQFYMGALAIDRDLGKNQARLSGKLYNGEGTSYLKRLDTDMQTIRDKGFTGWDLNCKDPVATLPKGPGGLH